MNTDYSNGKVTDKVTDNPKIKQKKLRDGNIRLYLDYYFGRVEVDGKSKVIRRRTSMGLTLWGNPANVKQKSENRATMELARRLRNEAEQNLLERRKGYRLPTDLQPSERCGDLLQWFADYAAGHDRGRCRVMRNTAAAFGRYLAGTSKLRGLSATLPPEMMSRDIAEGFAAWLRSTYKSTTAWGYLLRFRHLCRAAVKAGALECYPCEGVRIACDVHALRKDILSADEVARLLATECQSVQPLVRRAFVVSLYTGMRWGDVAALTWRSIDTANGLLSYTQRKTAEHSSRSSVTVPISPTLAAALGKAPRDRSRLVFDGLPCNYACNIELGRWVEAAGINKHITWHCARHSFAMLLLAAGTDIKTVSELMGHSSIATTEKYLRATNALKLAAIATLPAAKLL